MSQGWTGILYMGTGPTGSTGPTGNTGPTGPTPQGTNFGDYLYWNGSDWVVGGDDINLGTNAGETNQATEAIAIGYQAGSYNQATRAIAIGYQAGYTGQNPNSIAIGTQAGQFDLGSNSIAIGNLAGPTGAGYSNNIILNAQGSALNPNTGSALYVAPVRNTLSSNTYSLDVSNTLFYNPSTSEITYAPTVTGSTYISQGILDTDQTIASATDTSINFVDQYDPNSWWNSTTKVLQPTVAGYYNISLAAWFTPSTGAANTNVQARLNGNTFMILQNIPSTTVGVSLTGDKIIEMNGTTDVITFTAYSSSSDGRTLQYGGTSLGSGTWFSCKLLPTAKTFIIDHPLNPNKHLVHACLEGPEMGVYYRGKGTITPNTTSTLISLPNYVPAFASDFTIQITPLYNGQAPGLYAASDVVQGSFEVHGPPGSFYWHVHGSRGTLEVEPLRSDVVVRGDGPYKYIV